MGDVAVAVLGFPGKAFAHGFDRYKFGKFFQHHALACAPCAFDKLDHT